MLRSPTHLVGHGPTSSPHHMATTPNVHRLNFTTTTNNNNNNNNHNNNHLNGANTPTSPHVNGLFSNGSTTPTTPTNNGTTTITTLFQKNNSTATSSSSSTTTTSQATTRSSLFDSCHRKIRLIGGGPVAFLGGLVAKARRKERDGDQSSTDTKLYLEESVLERKLPDADLKALVDLPAGLDYNEWLASHTLALFEHVNLVYGTISEFCTTSGCQDMTGPGNRTYLWFDEKGKKTRVAAPQYIDYVMTFTQKTVSDESIFPTKYANEFPSSFESIARKILRLQFHVIAHLYAAHFKEIALLGLHTHLNLTFAHLTALHRRFNLIDEKETDVLRDLEVALRLTDEFSNNSGGSGTSSGGGAGNNSTTSSSTNGSNNSTINSSNNHHQGSGGAGIGGDHHNHHQQHRLLLGGTNDDNNLLNSGIAGRIDVVSSNINTNNILGNSGHSGLVGGGLIGVDITTSSSANASPRHPICTQPEAMKGLNSDQSDIRGGAGGGNCTDGSTYFKGGHSHQQVINFNNNHHNNSTGTSAYTANSMLQQQCNNSRSSQNNSNNSPHTTTTA